MEITNHSTLVYKGLNKMPKEKKKREVYHDGDGVLRYTNPEKEKKRISDLDKSAEKDDDKHLGENID